MRIYLISRHGRRAEMQTYAHELEEMGHEIASSWIFGDGRDDCECGSAELERRALQNMSDLRRSDCCLAFSEPPGSPYDRGGRHTEMGAALAWSKRCILVGPPENVFHHARQVELCYTFEEVKRRLGDSQKCRKRRLT